MIKVTLQDLNEKKHYEISVEPFIIDEMVMGFDIDIYNSTVRYFGQDETRPFTVFDAWVVESKHRLEIESLTEKEIKNA